jgi:hypothetical protein
MTDNGNKIFASFRFITPILVTIGLFMIAGIKGDVEKIDAKLFTHLTNEELHTPRNLVVSQDAFTIYQTMRDKEILNIQEILKDIKELLLLRKK